MASLLHSQSQDDNPHHEFCPKGEDSWCFYHRAEAKGQKPGPHQKHANTHVTTARAVANYRTIPPGLFLTYLHNNSAGLLLPYLHNNGEQFLFFLGQSSKVKVKGQPESDMT
jgi:hypothetical protein